MTRGVMVVVIAFAVLIAFVIHLMFPHVVWHWLFETQNGAIGVGLITGILSSLTATIVYGLRHKEIWRQDISELKLTVAQIKTYLETEIQLLRADQDLLLKQIPPAIGGPFTKSVFAFPPMASDRIADILSQQTGQQYGRHHKRVIVKTANDQYTIKELKEIDSTPVWVLEFHITWKWWNDSRITKYPLGDFLVVADSDPGVLDTFLPDDMANAEKESQYERRKEFLQGNIVRSIIVNPSHPEERLPDNLIDQVFRVERVYVNKKLIGKDQLKAVPKTELPMGVYAAWSLPKNDLECNPPLPVNSQLTVEYHGRVCLAAAQGVGNVFYGYMTFPPSDVISDRYELVLACPADLKFEGKPINFEVIEKSSGCRFIHGPLENKPQLDDSKGSRVAKITVPGPLTDLHQLSISWKAELNSADIHLP